MKKWIFLFLCLVIAGCSSQEPKTALTPEEALKLVENIAIGEVLTSKEMSDKEIFYVFSGKQSKQTEWFVAYLRKNEAGGWHVVEAVNIGLPNSSAYLNYSGGSLFRAAIRHESEQVNGKNLVISIPNQEYVIEIELIGGGQDE